MNLNKGCIEIGSSSLFPIQPGAMNLNKGCIEIGVFDAQATMQIVMNLNKGCIEIGKADSETRTVYWWTLTRVVLKFDDLGVERDTSYDEP